MSKGKLPSISDVIAFHNIETGGNSAGNGGAGTNSGNVNTNANNYLHAHTDTGGSLSDIHHAGVHVHASSDITNSIDATPTQMVEAGVGGNGGDNNMAFGGEVTIDLTHS
jgi:hypothetical protein